VGWSWRLASCLIGFDQRSDLEPALPACSTTVFSHSQTVVVCPSCNTVLCVPTGGKARLTEGACQAAWGQRQELQRRCALHMGLPAVSHCSEQHGFAA
jgi:hypothetical protein